MLKYKNALIALAILAGLSVLVKLVLNHKSK